MLEKLKNLLARKAKADALPAAVRVSYAAEYSKLRADMAATAVDVVERVLTKAREIQHQADAVAETLASEDYQRLAELAGRFEDYVAAELAGWTEVTGKTPWDTQDSGTAGREK